MGYFSELDLTNYENEWGSPSKVQQLTDQLCVLNERLINLGGWCPRDMLNPSFDRCFYSECLSGICDDVNTIQGVLQAIRKTEELLRVAEDEERRELEEQQRLLAWRTVVLETGATPDHQIVLMDAFFPVNDRLAAA